MAEQCEGVTVRGDGAYSNTGLIVPHRKRPGRPLLTCASNCQRKLAQRDEVLASPTRYEAQVGRRADEPGGASDRGGAGPATRAPELGDLHVQFGDEGVPRSRSSHNENDALSASVKRRTA
ncbi:hypothetical protein SHO565_32690 [Streptomyces sp. HO565]